MSARLGLTLVVLAALVAPSTGPAVAGGETGDAGRLAPGAYRGRVVELLTERPLEGAVVVFVWFWTPEQEEAWQGWAYRETLTDATGAFEIEASAIEAEMPAPARMPRLLVYKPGYATLPRERGERFGVPGSRLAAEGGIVALRPLTDLQERIDAFNLLMLSLSRLKGPRGAAREDIGRLLREEEAELWRLIRRQAPQED